MIKTAEEDIKYGKAIPFDKAYKETMKFIDENKKSKKKH